MVAGSRGWMRGFRLIFSEGKDMDPHIHAIDDEDGKAVFQKKGMAEAPSRRRFPAEYKLRVLESARDLRASGRGRLQEFLRKEGLRTSHLAEWRKQLARGRLGEGRRGRPGRGEKALFAEIRFCKRRLSAMAKKLLDADRVILLQRKYIIAASLRMERRDRGLLSELMAQVESLVSVSAACEALGLARRDFYRTVKPLRNRNG
jgi:transposase-like protein